MDLRVSPPTTPSPARLLLETPYAKYFPVSPLILARRFDHDQKWCEVTSFPALVTAHRPNILTRGLTQKYPLQKQPRTQRLERAREGRCESFLTSNTKSCS